MNSKYFLKLHQIEEHVKPYRNVLGIRRPGRGWVRSIQEALGITNVQLAKRLKLKPQTIEDMQEYEVKETIRLSTLRKLADALGCQLVYAIVPAKPLEEIRYERAREIAMRQLQNISHTMRLEAQGVSEKEQQQELDRLINELLSGNPKNLWE